MIDYSCFFTERKSLRDYFISYVIILTIPVGNYVRLNYEPLLFFRHPMGMYQNLENLIINYFTFLDFGSFEGLTMTPVGVIDTGFWLIIAHEAIWKPNEPAAKTQVAGFLGPKSSPKATHPAPQMKEAA